MTTPVPPTGDVQATPPVTPQAGDTPQPTPQAGDGKDYERIISELRKENAAHRTKLTAFERAQAEADAAKLSEVEKAAKRAADAEAALQEARQQIAAHNIYKVAAAMNFNNPDLATRLVALDADASDTDITKALQALATSDPYLIKAPEATPPAAAPRQAPSNPPRGATNPVAPAPFDPRNPPRDLGVLFKPKQ